MQRQSKPYFPLLGSPSSHLTIFTTICPLLSPSDPIDKSYFVPTFAVSFEVVYAGAGLILSKSRFRTPFAGSRGSSPQGAFPQDAGFSGLLRSAFGEILRISPSPLGESMFKRTWQVVFQAARIIPGVPKLSPQARTALYSEVVSRRRGTAEHVRKIFGTFSKQYTKRI